MSGRSGVDPGYTDTLPRPHRADQHRVVLLLEVCGHIRLPLPSVGYICICMIGHCLLLQILHRRDPDGLVAAPTFLCKVSMMTYINSPSRYLGDVEKQQLQHCLWRLPHLLSYRLPSGIDDRFYRLFMSVMGWFVLGHVDAKKFLEGVEKNDDWEKHNARFRDAVGQITTAVSVL